ncbi:metallophosphoesterase family protein [Paenibacillus tengchongensis]|uniref:metallophosphoesterase family protein n=1 Tax=Paenibacillus tengchongensis TaxID=2608684 RepID=UPI001FE43474|nr:metallophosphoesterase family protein [Paenibacillus tengchongensis]
MAISDIHGCHREFNALLAKADYSPSRDKLVLMGDYVDRGPDSRAVVEQVKMLHEQYGAIVLKGNHDQMACDALGSEDDDKLDTHWLTNGGYHTLMSYCGPEYFSEAAGWEEYKRAKAYIRDTFREHLDFLNGLPVYYESRRHLFVHAGIDPQLADWRAQRPYDFLWIREAFYKHPVLSTDKTVVFGHTPAVGLHQRAEIWFSPLGDKIGIDGACAYGYRLNALAIDEDAEDNGYEEYFVLPREGRRDL